MDDQQWARFETEFAARIADKIGSLYDASQISVAVAPRRDGHPAAVHIWAASKESTTGYPFLLNAYLVWRERAIEDLITRADPGYFEAYLNSVPRKMEEWMTKLPIDFGSRTQRESMVLVTLDHFDA